MVGEKTPSTWILGQPAPVDVWCFLYMYKKFMDFDAKVQQTWKSPQITVNAQIHGRR